MTLDQNNNRSVVHHLARRSIRTGGRSSILTIVTIALTAMLVAVMVLQTTGVIESEKKMLERSQQVIYENLSSDQMHQLRKDDHFSSTILNKTGSGVEVNDVLLFPCYFEPATRDMDSFTLSEGRMPESLSEAVVDKATLRAFHLPETLGTQITIPFLNSAPETFTLVGLTDLEADGVPLARHFIYLSLSYANKGKQLTEIPWSLLARIKDGAEMEGSKLKQLVYEIGSEYGIPYQYINPNNYYIMLRTSDSTKLLFTIIIGLALSVVSLVVIYSIFYLSVSERTRQFGQLRTIGMTPKQLRRMVRTEGWFLFIMGAPPGFVLASLFMFFFGPKNGWLLSNNLTAFAVSIVICAISVRLGVQKPAVLAASASPIDAARFQNTASVTIHSSSKPLLLTPFGLAKLNFLRGMKKQILTMLSLAVGGILFMAAAIYVEGWDLEAYSRQGAWNDSEYLIHFDYNTRNSMENGTSKMQLQGLMGDSLQSALQQLPDVESINEYHNIYVHYQWNDLKEEDSLTPFNRDKTEILEKYLEEGTADYDTLVQSGGIFVSGKGLWKEIYGKVPQVGDEIEVTYYNGETHTIRMPVMGVGSNQLIYELTEASLLLIPKETADAMVGSMDTTSMLSVSLKNNSHTKAQDEQMENLLSDYKELELSCLNNRIEEDQASYSAVRTMFLTAGGFVVLFSLVNLLNTLLSGLIARRRQLALLAVLGMTQKQIRKMLSYENLLLTGVNLIATLLLGTLAGWGICEIMDYIHADYVKFTFPVLWFLLYAVITIGSPAIINRICLKSFYKESLTDRLRSME